MARPEQASDVEQLRAELGMLRATLQQQIDLRLATEIEKAKHAVFLEWVALSAEKRTQLAADKKFAGLEGETWEVSLQEQPTVRLPARSEYEAIGRYNEICGILGTQHPYKAAPVGSLITASTGETWKAP